MNGVCLVWGNGFENGICLKALDLNSFQIKNKQDIGSITNKSWSNKFQYLWMPSNLLTAKWKQGWPRSNFPVCVSTCCIYWKAAEALLLVLSFSSTYLWRPQPRVGRRYLHISAGTTRGQAFPPDVLLSWHKSGGGKGREIKERASVIKFVSKWKNTCGQVQICIVFP